MTAPLVPGVRVGHHQRVTRGWRTGTTVVVLPEGTLGSVDVRGGAPGTRETDLLDPTATVSRVDAVCLTGGSAFGLAAADGVMHELELRGHGHQVVTVPGAVVPIVPTAVIFDLGRGSDVGHRPDAGFGRSATRAARATVPAQGAIGAGSGARSGGLQGGVGYASEVVEQHDAPDLVVAALVVVNSIGSVIDRETGLPWHPGDVALRPPSATDLRHLRRHLDAQAVPTAPSPVFNTTIGTIVTSAVLSKAECRRIATAGHDGMARAIRPVHGMFDGDTLFGLATCADEVTAPVGRSRLSRLDQLLTAAAECVARACTNAIVMATSTGSDPSYRDLCPSAFGTRRGGR
jgi:L-aminopeptidase/D-esterase-like protein